MPTITFALKDIQELTGKKLSIEDLNELMGYAKGAVEGYDKESDQVSVSVDDTNLPYLWSAEGLARLFRQVLGYSKGIAPLKIHKGEYQVIVDESVSKIRPYIASFVARGKKVSEYLLKQMIQLQEKLSEGYGRRREKIAIGVYRLGHISFPVTYKATHPESVRFVPLDFRKEMTQQEILEEHPKGIEYASLLAGAKKYPLLMDDKRVVLSFPPIINSAATGKVELGDQDLFIEATGTDQDSILLAMNIFAYALYERGFTIYSVDIRYKTKKITTPRMFEEKIKIRREAIHELLGIECSDAEVKRLIEKAGYGYHAGSVLIPAYRKDILHQNDVIEDIGIMYGYDKIPEYPMRSFTIGEQLPIHNFLDAAREIMLGLGFQEMMTSLLSNKKTLYDRMHVKDLGTVEIQQYTSETFSVVRTWLIPILMDILSKNKHIEYPQQIFEQGLVTVRKGDETLDYERIAAASCHERADYTTVKQNVDALLSSLGFAYEIEAYEYGSLIPGRSGLIWVNGKCIGFLGEIHPAVLEEFGLEFPVAVFELNLTELFELAKK
ncbi:phenylalanine--tRNA ligase subunit beta [Candidatus Woesearchaeota archaeon]|nr:phenylalanine--tRNA ligase subunit beta [Candidatus Woesearchaeota archaeon]